VPGMRYYQAMFDTPEQAAMQQRSDLARQQQRQNMQAKTRR